MKKYFKPFVLVMMLLVLVLSACASGEEVVSEDTSEEVAEEVVVLTSVARPSVSGRSDTPGRGCATAVRNGVILDVCDIQPKKTLTPGQGKQQSRHLVLSVEVHAAHEYRRVTGEWRVDGEPVSCVRNVRHVSATGVDCRLGRPGGAVTRRTRK